MELMQLKYFQLLARNQHLTKTAQELHITPPALSVSISKLEEELGTRLFDRTGRNIKLNANGQILLLYVDKIFHALEDAQQALNDAQKQPLDSVSLFIKDPAFYHKDFQKFFEDNPNVDFQQIGGDFTLGTNLFFEQALDFIITPRDLPSQINAERSVLYNDRFLLVVPSEHPLAGREEVSFSDLYKESFIAHPRTSFFQENVDILCEKHGFAPRYIMRCDYIMRIEMFNKGLGIMITTFHSSTTGYFNNAKFLKIKELKDEMYPFYIYWNKNRPLSPAAQRFKTYLEKFYEEVYSHLD